jgi:hypothetical protein
MSGAIRRVLRVDGSLAFRAIACIQTYALIKNCDHVHLLDSREQYSCFCFWRVYLISFHESYMMAYMSLQSFPIQKEDVISSNNQGLSLFATGFFSI